LIRIATDPPGDRLSRHISAASSAAHSHGSEEVRHSQNYGINDPQAISTRPQHGTLTPSPTIDLMSPNQSSPTERVSTMDMCPNRGTSFRSQTGGGESWNHVNGTHGSHRMGGQFLLASPELNGIQGIHTTYSTITPVDEFNSGVSGRARTDTVGHNYIQSHVGNPRSPDQTWPAQRANTSGSARSNSTVTQAQAGDHKRTTFPDLAMELVNARRAEGGPLKFRRLLPGEHPAMLFLKQRDHVSLRTRSSQTTIPHSPKHIR
jgi:hypothetical protein